MVSFEKAMNEINLHSGQVFVLISLFNQDGQSQIELSKSLNLAPPTVNKMIKNLIEDDFVVQKAMIDDGRILRVFLTEKGFDSRNLIEEQWIKIEKQMFCRFYRNRKTYLVSTFRKTEKKFDWRELPDM